MLQRAKRSSYQRSDSSYPSPAALLSDSLSIHHLGFTTLGSLPSYPYVAGVANVGWNSPYCGSCWGVSYKGKTIYVTAIDSSGVGFALSSKAIQQLTGPDGMRAGKVPVTYWAASPSDCSKPPSSWYVPPLVYDNLVADDLPSSKR